MYRSRAFLLSTKVVCIFLNQPLTSILLTYLWNTTILLLIVLVLLAQIFSNFMGKEKISGKDTVKSAKICHCILSLLYFAYLRLIKSQNLTRNPCPPDSCGLYSVQYSVHCTLNTGTLALNRQNTSSPKYDDISLLIYVTIPHL